MRPTVKRALVSTLVTGALVVGASTPGLATEDTSITTATAENSAAATPTDADTTSAEPTASESTESSTADTATASTQPEPAANEAESAGTVTGPTQPAAETAPAAPPAATDTVEVTEAYANWDFRRGFREYVGFENEALSEGLQIQAKGKHLLWSPQPGQTLKLDGTSGQLKFAGKINWTKYEGILNVRIANPTIDFEKKVLLVDGYTAGTLAKAGEVTFTQEAIATLPDLKVEQHEGYLVISSHKPVFNERVKDLVGLYQNEMAAPLVVTVATDKLESTDTPQPVLWELFPALYKNPVNGPVYTDAPLTTVNIPDANLAACIRETVGVATEIPITNKHLESLQQLKCINKGIKTLSGLEHAVNLNWVNFYSNQLNDLSPLSKATKLKIVEVGKNQLTNLKGLENSPLINQLSAEENHINDASVVKNLIRIDNLDLSDNRISDISELSVKTYDDEKITTLNLSKNRIADLSKYDAEFPFVRNLDLSHNQISDLGQLPKKRGFERLNLEYNFITDPSPFGAWATDRYRGNFEQLRIRYNKFTDWTSLKPLADLNKVFYYPESGSSDSLVNPKSLDEVTEKNAATDAEIAKAAEARALADAAAKKATEEAAIKAKSWDATLSWGVKESFRDYVSGSFAGGKWTVADGVTDTFKFPLLATQKINPLEHQKLAFGGKVHFTAHHGILDMTIANPSVENINGTWKLYADVATRPFDKANLGSYLGLNLPGSSKPALAPVSALTRSEIADLGNPTESTQNGTKVLYFGNVTLSAAGAAAFANFYKPGQTLDVLNIAIKEGTPSGVTSTYSPAEPKADSTQPVESPAVKPAEKTYTASFTWGIKDSFRNYIKGDLAQGNWKLSGGVTGEFTFPLKDGVKVDPKNYNKLDFNGTVHFKAHHGILNLALSNPSLAKTSNGWELTATVTSTPFDKKDIGKYLTNGFRNAANAPETRRVVIATLPEPTVKTNGDNLGLSFGPAVLTAAGSEAFSKFYPAGQVMDAAAVNITVKGTESTPVVPDNNANTTPANPNTDNNAAEENKNDTNNGTETSYTAYLNWGVKDSFRSYVKGGIAQGDWVRTGGVEGEFIFPLRDGVTLNPQNYNNLDFKGGVQFRGHHGLLDLTISQPSIAYVNGKWELTATVTSKPFNKADVAKVLSGAMTAAPGTPVTTRAVIATLAEPRVTKNGENLELAFGSAILTAAGSEAFSKFYPAGQVMDSVTVIIRAASKPLENPENDTDNSAQDQTGAAGENNLQNGTNNSGKASGNKAKTNTTEKAKKKCEVDPTKQRITGGNLAWGVRSSFTSYIRGSIAHGGWNLNGTSWDGANFNWAATGGVYNTATKSGTVYYGGSVSFYGHDGILDLTLSNPSLTINGNYAALYLTVNGSDMQGKKFSLGRVHFADVALNGVYVANGTLNFQNAAVTLTAAGAKAFVGFYQAGTALAPLSSSVSLVNATACDPETGELIEYGAFGGVLANTGTELQGLLGASLLALIMGVGALSLRRRQQS